MTVPSADPTPLTWDDLDRLADWTAGQLTGPDADHIAHLVATDPRWTHAHTTITTNQPTITNALNTTAPTPHEPIPHDILTRLTTALHNATPHTDLPTRRRRHPLRMMLSTRHPAARARFAGAVAVVLLVCAGGAVALDQLAPAGDNAPTSTEAGAPLHSGIAPAPPRADMAMPPTVASGTDYTEATLPLVAQLLASARRPEPTALQPFADADTYAACVAAVTATHPGTPVLVDIARYQGHPAVIVLLQGDDRRLTAVATRTTCGRDGADELAAVVFD